MSRKQLERKFPGWHVWRGVARTGWYAWRPRSSPPWVVRAPTLDKLADAITLKITRPWPHLDRLQLAARGGA